MKRRSKNRCPASKAPDFFSISRRQGLALRAVPLLLVALLALGIQAPVEAATIPIGLAPSDTCISKDGSMSFVLDAGGSTLTVLDPASHAITSVINLGLGAGVALDCDWNETLQRVLVGCTNGMVLWADPALGASGVFANNPGANYGVFCADHCGAGVEGYAVDGNTGWLPPVQLRWRVGADCAHARGHSGRDRGEVHGPRCSCHAGWLPARGGNERRGLHERPGL